MSKPTNVPVVTALTPISAQNTATEIVNLRAHDCDGTVSVTLLGLHFESRVLPMVATIWRGDLGTR